MLVIGLRRALMLSCCPPTFRRTFRALGARRVVVALPVASAEACQKLDHEADEVICLSTPALFRAVGEWYADFSQTLDEEVTQLLRSPPVGAR